MAGPAARLRAARRVGTHARSGACKHGAAALKSQTHGRFCVCLMAVPYEYVPFAAPGYWQPNPTLPAASFYDEFFNEDALDALK